MTCVPIDMNLWPKLTKKWIHLIDIVVMIIGSFCVAWDVKWASDKNIKEKVVEKYMFHVKVVLGTCWNKMVGWLNLNWWGNYVKMGLYNMCVWLNYPETCAEIQGINPWSFD
jgi:hypothetical protein